MERRPSLRYEPKILLDLILPSGEKASIFIRGNAYESDVLSRVGFSHHTHRLYLEGEPLGEGNLKDLGIKHHTLLEVKRR